MPSFRFEEDLILSVSFTDDTGHYVPEKVAVLVPCLNEAASIGSVVSGFKELYPGMKVIVGDDGSTDGTAEEARRTGAEVVKCFGIGKGAAMRVLFDYARASYGCEWVVFIDGDGTYSPADLCRMMDAADGADIVIGRRIDYKGKTHPSLRLIGNRISPFFTRLFFGGSIADTLSGYRLIRSSALSGFGFRSKGFSVETEMNAYFLRGMFSVKSVDVSYRDRPDGSFSKMSTFRDGFSILASYVRFSGKRGAVILSVPALAVLAYLGNRRKGRPA